MEKLTKKVLEAQTNEELIGIIDDIAELKNKELETSGTKKELVAVILAEQSEGDDSALSNTSYKVLKTFDATVDGKRFSMTAGETGPIPDELMDELVDGGFLELPVEEK